MWFDLIALSIYVTFGAGYSLTFSRHAIHIAEFAKKFEIFIGFLLHLDIKFRLK